MRLLSSIFFSITGKLSKFKSCRRGAIAVEFALIFPILLLIYVSSIELQRMYTVNRVTNQVSSAISNIVSSHPEISRSSDLPIILSLIKPLMYPIETSYSDPDLEIVIASLQLGRAPTSTTECTHTDSLLNSFVAWILTKESISSEIVNADVNGVAWTVDRVIPAELQLPLTVNNTPADLRDAVLRPCADMIAVQTAYHYSGIFVTKMTEFWGAPKIWVQSISCCSRPYFVGKIKVTS